MLQGKGGVGKTIVASMIAQFYRDKGREIACWDADPINASFAGIKALGAQAVPIMDGYDLNVPELDRLLTAVLGASSDSVVDSGAASFAPLSDYLLKSDIPTLAEENGCHLVAHVVLAGGGSKIDTQSGLVSVLSSYPESVRIVVWLNEYFGTLSDRPFEGTPVYAENKHRIDGVVVLRRLDPKFAGWNMAQVLEARQIFSEAIEKADVIAKSRLLRIKRDIWAQLEGFL